jgi:hypothetical protein
MLNTDLHSPQVRKRMTVEDYSRNLKGVNDNKDFAPEYIVSLVIHSAKCAIMIDLLSRKVFTTIFANARSSCRKNTLANLASSLLGRNCFTEHAQLVSPVFHPPQTDGC